MRALLARLPTTAIAPSPPQTLPGRACGVVEGLRVRLSPPPADNHIRMIYPLGLFFSFGFLMSAAEFAENRFVKKEGRGDGRLDQAISWVLVISLVLSDLFGFAAIGLLPFSIYSCVGANGFWECFFFTLPWWD